MPKYRLNYFQGKGRGELPRLLFAVAGVEFEDKRYSGEDWKKMKEGTKWKMMPTLQVDDKEYFQSSAIYRFLAREFGLYGANNQDAVVIDEVIGIIDDIAVLLMGVFYEKDEAVKEAKKKVAREEKVPASLALLSIILKESGTGFCRGSKITLADLAVYNMMENVEQTFGGDPYKGFPEVKKLVDRVGADSKVKAWNDKHAAKK